jgi:triosephosphate isomerase
MNGLRADAWRWPASSPAGPRGGPGPGHARLFPPATVLAAVAERLRDTGIIAGGQDCHERASGAFTGSLSAAMLKDAGAEAVIVGHSERRHGLGETDALVRAKAEAGLGAGLLVVLCVGETEAEWLEGRTLERLSAQLEGSLPRGDATGSRRTARRRLRAGLGDRHRPHGQPR